MNAPYEKTPGFSGNLPPFDELLALYRDDPVAFDRLRSRLLQQAVDDAPSTQRESLTLLVEKLDAVRAAAPSGEAAAAEAFRMMQQSVARLGEALQRARQEAAKLQTTVILKQISLGASLDRSRTSASPKLRRHRDRM